MAQPPARRRRPHRVRAPCSPRQPSTASASASGSVTIDPVKAKVAGSVGEFGWGGAASTAFWVDPVEDLTVLFFTQLLPSSTHPIRASCASSCTKRSSTDRPPTAPRHHGATAPRRHNSSGQRGSSATTFPCSSRRVRVSRAPFEERPVVRHQQHRARERVERLFELLDRGQVEMVRRLVEHDEVRPVGHQQRERGAGALPGRQRPADGGRGRRPARTSPARSRLRHRHPVSRMNTRSNGASPISRPEPVRSRRPRRSPEPRCRVGATAEQHLDQRRLARSVAADQGDAFAELICKVIGPSRKSPRSTTARRAARRIAAATGDRDVEAQLPRLPRLVDLVEPLDRPSRCAPPCRRAARSG